MIQPWRKGRVIRIEKETPTTRRFWIEVPELSSFDFLPGQFVTLDLPIHEKASRRWKSYSISSWPDGSNIFELVIVHQDNGAGTTYLFEEVKPGTEIPFRGAQGTFTLPDALDKDLFLVCTGTGIAPFRSMVQHIHHRNIAHKKIYLVFGTRTRADLLYYNELTALQSKLTGFNYIPVLSREQWEGKTGYVHAAYEEICLANKNGHEDVSPAGFYLCGWKNMIDEAKKRITALGYDKKSIHQELYG
jgi:glycine betaine catabolism B